MRELSIEIQKLFRFAIEFTNTDIVKLTDLHRKITTTDPKLLDERGIISDEIAALYDLIEILKAGQNKETF